MADARKFVGLDVGGTTMKAAVVDARGHAFPHVSLPTEPERGAAAGLERMCEAIRLAVAEAGISVDDLTAIGVATPGMMDIPRGLILDPPNLKPWRNVEVPKFVSGVFGKPVAFQNDANAAAMGEFWVGAGRDYTSMVLMTLGTGVGGGIILQDRVLEGAHSHGGELGHLRIDLPDHGRLCGCGRRGCLEAYASATAVVARTREALAESDEPSHLRDLSPDEFTAEAIFDAAHVLDPLALKIVADTALYLGLGAAALISTIDPQAIVFGGGMTAAGEAFLNQIRDAVRKYALSYPAERVHIRYATLGSDAGFIGAAACAKMLADRTATS
jgi:glucokinase